MRIVVTGYMIRYPLAGNLLAFFHYVLGLRLLGHDVVYLEESGWPNSCYDPLSRHYGDDPEPGLRSVRALFDEHGVDVPLVFVHRETARIFGTEWDDLRRTLREADLLLNIGGVCWLDEFRLCPRRAFIDMDPLFTQLGVFGAEALHEHGVHFSYGGNIGRADCAIPTLGIDWRPTAPPVVSTLWEHQSTPGEGGVFTTIAHWNAYKNVTFSGQRYGQKSEEFTRVLDLPARVAQKLELALTGAGPKVTGELERAGWSVRDAFETTMNTGVYQTYVTRSRGEFSVAKNGYVKARTGWFSDRSVCYLAAGLPVVLQDTGFSDWLPTGRGLLAFSSLDEAAQCIELVNADYAAHRRAARALTRRAFDHAVVLPRMLQTALAEA